MATGESSSLQDLVQQKEHEWREAQDLQIKSLQNALTEKERQLNNEKLRFRKLKEDFEYNLRLLEERDKELNRYDVLFVQAKNVNSVRDAEVSELKIKLDDLKVKLSHEEKAKEELQKHYQQRLREHQLELNQFRQIKENEVEKEREEFEVFKRELQLQLRAAEEDVEAQRQELMAGFDDALRKREHEFRKKADDLSNAALASELKVKMLTKELELVRVSGERTKDELEDTETAVHELEKQLKQKEWEITDQHNMNRAKVSELEAEIEQLKSSMSKAQHRFEHKHANLDQYAKEKEQALIAAKDAHNELEHSLEAKIRALQNQLEVEQVECRRLQWANKDTEKEKQLEVQRLQRLIADLEEKLNKQSSENARSVVARDLELEALRQQEEKMRLEIVQIKETTDRYKKELTMALERESSLERSRAQLEVDWQRRCEDTEREVYHKQEQLISGLTKQRDESAALAKERLRELSQRDDLIRILTMTRDQAFATLQRHGLTIPTQLPNKEKEEAVSAHLAGDLQHLAPEERIKALVEQNENLRVVIRQMRDDMEDLSSHLATRPGPSVPMQSKEEESETSPPLTKEYVDSLEKELMELKSKNRALRKQIDDTSLAKPSTHVQTTSQQVRQKQLVVDQLQYELTTQGRRATDEFGTLKQRVTELELQLVQTRREADEYFKSGLERNAEATSLGNQLSTLKVELASHGRGSASFSPQTAIVKQLQDEVLRLRRQISSGIQTNEGGFLGAESSIRPASQDLSSLHSKLKAAARRISQLSQEKEQLIQMGNRLRADLAKYTVLYSPGDRRGVGPGGLPADSSNLAVGGGVMGRTPGELREDLHGQLSAVEKLQYQLTSHELQFAQRMAQKEQYAAEKVQISAVSSSSDSGDG
ncbi:Coiled-coil domain-containing protein 57 [Acropora cervicornis]|uniref:Coiled-coil domain-containing protein 57 n=1 Tax=Acropora cervicornis TaxID=6130 RepID=A0AAD9VEV4_ACRCE|nr:Coiled-coil domain-containing protein 57 [Acropora cervicornis]